MIQTEKHRSQNVVKRLQYDVSQIAFFFELFLGVDFVVFDQFENGPEDLELFEKSEGPASSAQPSSCEVEDFFVEEGNGFWEIARSVESLD